MLDYYKARIEALQKRIKELEVELSEKKSLAENTLRKLENELEKQINK